MKDDKMQIQTGAGNDRVELLDDIERVLFKARDAQRPFTEYLLYMAFMEELGQADPGGRSKPRKGVR